MVSSRKREKITINVGEKKKNSLTLNEFSKFKGELTGQFRIPGSQTEKKIYTYLIILFSKFCDEIMGVRKVLSVRPRVSEGFLEDCSAFVLLP